MTSNECEGDFKNIDISKLSFLITNPDSPILQSQEINEICKINIKKFLELGFFFQFNLTNNLLKVISLNRKHSNTTYRYCGLYNFLQISEFFDEIYAQLRFSLL